MKMKSRKTNKGETSVKNLLHTISTDVKEYGFILKEQMNLISDINIVLLMQHTTNEKFAVNNNEITKKCIYLTKQFAKKIELLIIL